MQSTSAQYCRREQGLINPSLKLIEQMSDPDPDPDFSQYQTQMSYRSLRVGSPPNRLSVASGPKTTISNATAKIPLDERWNGRMRPPETLQTKAAYSPPAANPTSKADTTPRSVVSNPFREETGAGPTEEQKQPINKAGLVLPSAQSRSRTPATSLQKRAVILDSAVLRLTTKITSDQRGLLDNDHTWQPPFVGESCRDGQVPVDKLDSWYAVQREAFSQEEVAPDTIVSDLPSSPPASTNVSWSQSEYGSPQNPQQIDRVLPPDSSPLRSMMRTQELGVENQRSQRVATSPVVSVTRPGQTQSISRDVEMNLQDGATSGEESGEDKPADTPRSRLGTLLKSASVERRLEPSTSDWISTSIRSSLESTKIVQVSRTPNLKREKREDPQKITGNGNEQTHNSLQLESQPNFLRSLSPRSFMVPGTYGPDPSSQILPVDQRPSAVMNSVGTTVPKTTTKKTRVSSPEEISAKRQKVMQSRAQTAARSEWTPWEEKLRQDRRTEIARNRDREFESEAQPILPNPAQVLDSHLDRSQDSSVKQWLEKTSGAASSVLDTLPVETNRQASICPTASGENKKRQPQTKAFRGFNHRLFSTTVGSEVPAMQFSGSKNVQDEQSKSSQGLHKPETDTLAMDKTYVKYKKCYPSYEGSLEQFYQACDLLRQLGSRPLHISVFDDFVFRHHHEYQLKYLPSVSESQPLPYAVYYYDRVSQPKHNDLVISRDYIRARRTPEIGVFSEYSNECATQSRNKGVEIHRWRGRQ